MGSDPRRKLNREWPARRNQVAVMLCVSKLKGQGMYEVVNVVPLNELSKEMFVYKVLDEMISRQMYGLAEQVVSCVGICEAPEEEEQKEEEEEEDDSDDSERMTTITTSDGGSRSVICYKVIALFLLH